MKQFFLKGTHEFFAAYKQQIISFVIIFLSTFYVFPGVLEGKIISNAHNLYYFEPWVHYKQEGENEGNLILSDLIDGPTSRYHMAEQLRQGEIPVWDFGNKLGNIGVTNLLGSFFYPFRLVPWLLFGVPIGWTIETIIKFSVGGFFMYLLLRKLKVNNWISLIVSIGYMYGGAQLAESQTEYSSVTLSAPILFYFLERFFQQSTWKNSLWLLMSALLMLTTSFVSVIFFFMFWLSLYSVLRFSLTIENKGDVFFKLIVTAIAFLFISSVALYSTAEFFGNESGINLAYRESYGLRQAHIYGSLTFIASHFFGHGLLDTTNWKYGTYVNLTVFVGYLTFLSALVGGISRALCKKEFKTIIILIFIALLFFGIYQLSFEKFEAITNRLPFFHGNPSMYQKSVLQFMIAVLGGLGLDYILNTDFRGRRIEGSIIFILSTVAVGVSIWLLNYFFKQSLDPSDFYVLYVDRIQFIVILTWFCFNLLAFKELLFPKIQIFLSDWVSREFGKNKKGMNLFVNVIMSVLLIIYLYEAQLNARDWIPYARTSQWYQDTQMTDYLYKNLGYSRVLPIGSGVSVPATLEAYGFPLAAGRMPVPETYERLLQNAYPKAYVDHPTQVIFDANETNLIDLVWKLADVKYFVASKNIDKKLLDEKYGDNISIIELPDSTLIENISRPGHAWLANDGVIASTPEQMSEITKGDWDINKGVVLFSDDYLLTNDESEYHSGDRAKGQILKYIQGANKISIDLKNEEPVYLIVSSSYFPGWKAKVDGIKTDIVPAYGFLQAIKIEESGEHKVELFFKPDGLIYGGIISIIGIIATCIVYVYLIKREEAD